MFIPMTSQTPEADRWCDFCDIHDCEHITGAGKRYDGSVGGPVSGLGTGPEIQANIHGRCAGCGVTKIEPGDSIRHSTEAGGWVAGCCF